MSDDRAPITTSGDLERAEEVIAALADVVDPEMSLDIVAIGLVYDVAAGDKDVSVTMTMTSAACPVTELIVAEVEERLATLLPHDVAVRVEIVWWPPWTPERMSGRARSAMGWD